MQRVCNTKKRVYFLNAVSISSCVENPSEQSAGPYTFGKDFAIDFNKSQIYM